MIGPHFPTIAVQAPQHQQTTQTAHPAQLRDIFDQIFDLSQIVKELDTDGDGTVSEQELAFYRARKAARGEYRPADGPNGPPQSAEQVEQATVDEMLKRL